MSLMELVCTPVLALAHNLHSNVAHHEPLLRHTDNSSSPDGVRERPRLGLAKGEGGVSLVFQPTPRCVPQKTRPSMEKSGDDRVLS